MTKIFIKKREFNIFIWASYVDFTVLTTWGLGNNKKP